MMRATMSVILILFFISCSDSSATIDTDLYGIGKTAADKLGDNYKLVFNSDSTFLFAYHTELSDKNKSQSDTPVPSAPLIFFIYDIKNNKIIFEDNLPNGTAAWTNNRRLKVETVPGIIKGGSEEDSYIAGYLYDVILKKKLKLNEGIMQQ